MQTQLMLSEHISKALNLNTQFEHKCTLIAQVEHTGLPPLTIVQLFSITSSCHHLSTLAKLCLKCHTPVPHLQSAILPHHLTNSFFVRYTSVERGFPYYAFYSHCMRCVITPQALKHQHKPTDMMGEVRRWVG